MKANIKEWKIGECAFKVIEVDGEVYLNDFGFSVMKISIDTPKHRLPNKYYLIYRKDKPYLDYAPYMLVELYYDCNPIFPAYTLWHNYLLVARYDDFYCIDLFTCEKHVFPPKESNKFGYFGYFYQVSDRLLVASDSRLYCFDENLVLIWQTEEIACDGVLVGEYKDGYLDVLGENDPPGGWIKYKVDFITGQTIKIGWRVTDDYCGFAKAFDENPEFTQKQFARLMKGNKKKRK